MKNVKHPKLATTDAAHDAARACNAFALDLFAVVNEQPGNLFLSPVSVELALAMTLTGARGNTAVEMSNVLHLQALGERRGAALEALQRRFQQPAGDCQLNLANRLWGAADAAYLPEFLRLTREHFDAELAQLDFRCEEESRRTINAWVAEQTHDKIRDLIPRGALGDDTRLVLTNAIYFYGPWQTEFDARRTEDDFFFPAPGREVIVPMMRQKSRFGYAQTEDLQILRLGYRGERLSMLVLLPTARDGLPALEKNLTPANLTVWRAQLVEREVEVFLPRFRVSAQFDLCEALQTLGMKDGFSLSADFSGMSASENLMITHVIHQAFVDVNEKGTEAAAATAVMEATKCVVLPPPVFRADHPFLFVICDDPTGAILFLGRLTNPEPA